MTDLEKQIAIACGQVDKSYADYTNDVMTTPITVKQAIQQLGYLVNRELSEENQRLKKAILDFGNNPAGI